MKLKLMNQTTRVMTAALIAVVMVLIAVTGWAVYETRRAIAAESKVASEQRLVEQKSLDLRRRANGTKVILNMVSRHLNELSAVCRLWSHSAISVNLANNLALESAAITKLIKYGDGAAWPELDKELNQKIHGGGKYLPPRD